MKLKKKLKLFLIIDIIKNYVNTEIEGAVPGTAIAGNLPLYI